ncbi:GPP34 family phosphoprotein [Streptomyces sp. SCA3-4]|uniref:GOLPH3/VPS74 family protein n=1 Tax=Streptomyces sichuanensis TaxID=2871810 RepID=UPI001CE31F3F|nr:GPP34 family phosphoprotein [Streptomyces sichuanensis]MCA6094723.1 GPP34 family phosphoprotein [Streptomyces sichuanensis]
MTTPRDLLITVMDELPGDPAERGEVSLGLAGAELIDLLASGAATLGGDDGDRIVPGPSADMDDQLLQQAAASLVPEAPYESVGDWLWRRGRDLASAYVAALEADGHVRRQRRSWTFRPGRPVLTDSLDHRLAGDRRRSDEPVLAALVTAVGIRDEEDEGDAPGVADDAVDTVLAAVNGAVVELEALRQRRAIEQSAFDNIWRGD